MAARSGSSIIFIIKIYLIRAETLSSISSISSIVFVLKIISILSRFCLILSFIGEAIVPNMKTYADVYVNR